MKHNLTPKACLTLALMMATHMIMVAQGSEQPDQKPDMLYAPLVYDG